MGMTDIYAFEKITVDAAGQRVPGELWLTTDGMVHDPDTQALAFSLTRLPGSHRWRVQDGKDPEEYECLPSRAAAWKVFARWVGDSQYPNAATMGTPTERSSK